MSEAGKTGQKSRFEELTEELETLRKEAAKLNETRIRIEAEVERARSEKKSLEENLLADYGTCDMAELKSRLGEMEKSNEAAVAGYRESVERARRETGEMVRVLAGMGIRV